MQRNLNAVPFTSSPLLTPERIRHEPDCFVDLPKGILLAPSPYGPAHEPATPSRINSEFVLIAKGGKRRPWSRTKQMTGLERTPAKTIILTLPQAALLCEAMRFGGVALVADTNGKGRNVLKLWSRTKQMTGLERTPAKTIILTLPQAALLCEAMRFGGVALVADTNGKGRNVLKLSFSGEPFNNVSLGRVWAGARGNDAVTYPENPMDHHPLAFSTFDAGGGHIRTPVQYSWTTPCAEPWRLANTGDRWPSSSPTTLQISGRYSERLTPWPPLRPCSTMTGLRWSHRHHHHHETLPRLDNLEV